MGLVIGHLFQHQRGPGKHRAKVSSEQIRESTLFLLCQARRLALNVLCLMDGDWHHEEPNTANRQRELRDSPGCLQARRSGCREETQSLKTPQ